MSNAAEYNTEKSTDAQIVWTSNPPFSTKWKKTIKKVSKIEVGQTENESDTAATIAAGNPAIEDVKQARGPGGMWSTSYVVTTVVWENLGNYLGGVRQ